MTLALTGLLSKTARHAEQTADRKACREGLFLARALAAVYAIRPERSPDDGARHPVFLPASNAAEMTTMIRDHASAVRACDPADTRGALTAVWYAVSVAACLARFVASRDDGFLPAAADSATADLVTALESAPSLPADIRGVGLQTTGPSKSDPGLLAIARSGVRMLADISGQALERIADLARDHKDRDAAVAALPAALELGVLSTRSATD